MLAVPNVAMATPRLQAPREVILVSAAGCPCGLLGKLACASKEFRDACMAEAERRARASGAATPPGGVRLPPVSARLLTSADEVDWAVSCGVKADASLGIALAAAGSVPALARAAELGAPLTLLQARAAARHGRLDALKWLLEQAAWDSGWWSLVCADAAYWGHLEVLELALETNVRFDIWVTYHAAWQGRLELLKWAMANGAPWHGLACDAAASAGRLDVLKWAWKKGLPCDEETCLAAAKGGHLDVLSWAVDSGLDENCFGPCWGASSCVCYPCMARAAEDAGHPLVADWIRELTADWSWVLE